VKQKSEATILSKLNLFKKIFTGRFLGKFVANWLLKMPPTLVVEFLITSSQSQPTLPCGWGFGEGIVPSPE